MTGKGGYVVGFTVHEAKELSRDGNTVDPICVVRALGREYKTEMKRHKMSHVKFEESFIWSDIQLSPDEYNSAFIDFDLQSAMTFTRNETIGTGKVQLSMVRRRPNHTYVKKWIQLSTGTMKTAKLKVTVFSYGEGDAPPRPEDLENDADETAAHLNDLGAAVLNTDVGNTQKTFTTGYHLFVQVHRAEHLGGGARNYNPYVTVEFAGNTLSTQPAKETHTLAFDECFRLPVTMPLFSDSIIIRVWDKKSWSSDEIIVQGRLSFSLIRTHALQPKWFNFYGFSTEEVPDLASIMGTGERPEPNTYQGRILVSGRAQKVLKENDLFKPAALKGLVQDEPASLAQTILCDIFEISGCPGKEVYCHIAFGRTAKKIKPVKRHRDSESQESDQPGIFRFPNEKGSMPPMNVVMPAAPEQQLDIILSIYSDLDSMFDGLKHQRIGFARLKMKDVPNWNGEATAPRWISCHPMAHLPVGVEPGAILCSVYKCAKLEGQREQCHVRVQKFQLRVYACMARGLVSGSTQPNSLLHAACAGENKKTEVDPITAEPMWNTCLNLPIRLQVAEKDSKAYPEPIQITVYDQVGEDKSLYEQLKVAAIGQEEPKEEEDNKNKKELQKLKQQEDSYSMMARLAQNAVETAVDHVGVMKGDIMAKKRVGAVAQGRKVIGRVQVTYKRIRRPGDNGGFSPKWLKLKGGMMGNTHVGDILVGFELLKSKHTSIMPERDFRVPMHQCSLFASILGLRNVDPVNGGDVKTPTIRIAVNSVGMDTCTEELVWKKKPPEKQQMGDKIVQVALNKDDVNRKWELNSKQGFEFCQVVHLPIFLPLDPIWAPSCQFVIAEGDTFIGDGSLQLAHYIPWSDHDETEYLITAKAEFSDSDSDGEGDGGVVVSEDEDIGDNGPSVQYMTIKIENEALGVSFNPEDKINFPPRVLKVQEKGKVAKSGIKSQDWLIGVKLPTPEPEKNMVMWTPAEASKFLENCDKQRMRPLVLRFRRLLRNEVTVTVKQDALGLDLERVPQPPPKFAKDNTKALIYTKSAIDPGWHLVAVNAIDTAGMSGVDPRMKQLLSKRPCVMTFRAPKDLNVGSVVQERQATQGKPVQLSGLPKELDPKCSPVDKNKWATQKLGPLRFTRVPKPMPVLPDTSDSKRLNLHPARASCLDVRGIIRAVFGGGEDGVDDDGDDHARPTVNGTLEEHLPQPFFETVPLSNGQVNVGSLKVRIHVIDRVYPDWPLDRPPGHRAADFYDPFKFRKWIKADTPAVFRVRSYVVRGLNVSGANSGYGNPYLFFVYGQQPVKLPGNRQMHTVEPRFFRTEERDVKMPEQSTYEVGLYDYMEGYEDQLIGKSFVDLEDRWFSPAYKEMVKNNKVPIEYRPLQSADMGSLCKGSLEMWIDLIDSASAAEVPISSLRPPPPVEVEIRVVIWSVKDVSLRLCYDENTGEPREKIDILAKVQLDCRSYNGAQPKEQDTDVHHSSDGEGEFNWRVVFSRISVTKGVPLDCFLQISLLEHFSFSKPEVLCETLVDMKNYCKKVALTGERLSIEAELPMENQQLKRVLKQDRASGGTDVNLDGEDYDYEDEDSDEEEAGDEEAMNAGGHEEFQIPPAGIIKVLVDVYAQVEASTSELKVGLGRDEPNRNPVLTFPKTGRSWQSVLPTALAVVDAVMEAYQGGTKRMKWLCCCVVIIMTIVGLHSVPGSGGCPIIQDSCKISCACCQTCHDNTKQDATFCFYRGIQNTDGCTDKSTSKGTNCRCASDDCGAPAPPCNVAAAAVGTVTAAPR